MYGQGRGGGRGGGFGGGKRPMTALPLRPVSASGSTRSTIGGGGPRRPGTSHAGGGGGGAPAGKEESFTLSSANKFEFGSIVRLTPDLVEEILRVESQGGVAKIKFAPKEGIATGNVIDVGGKEFGFKWFNDQKCDIYEEHRSGENGDGLLVECGPSWRQLNVDRILDESMKRLVKKRSEEAEIKSRVTIVLDPSNPGVVQKMAAAGVEGNNRRMGWNKRESYPKRQKADSIQGPHKSIFKSVTSNKSAKAVSASPISSPFTTGTSSKYARGVTPPIDMSTEHIDTGNFEKEDPSKNVRGNKNKFGGQRMHTNDPFMNVQNNREGKSSENANDISSKIEAAKRYLKPAVEADSSTRRGYESLSPPGNSLDIALATESIFGEKNIDENHAVPSPKLAVEDEEDPFEKIDIMQDTPDLFNNDEKKVTNDSDGKTNSSESGTDSDSESDSSGTDSGSQSRSRSKSKSPVGSASSSDSESDVSSSSKEASDIDVNIMTSGDEKEEDVPNVSAMNDNEQIDIMEDQQIDILGDDEDNVANDFGRNDNMTYPAEDAVNLYNGSSMKNAEVLGNIYDSRVGSDSHREHSRYSVDSPHTQHAKTLNDTDEKPQNENDGENLPLFNDWPANEKAEKRKNKKSRRSTGSEASKENSENAKRYKEAKEANNISPGQNKQNEHQLYNNQLDAKDDFPHNTKLQHTPEFFSSSNVDAEYGHTGTRRKSTGSNSRKKMERNPAHTDIRDVQTDLNAHEKLSSIRENNGSHNRNFNHKNKSPVPTVDSRVLRREVSELELGELREPVVDPKASSKISDNKSTSNDSSNPQRTTYFQGQKHSTTDCTDPPEKSTPSFPHQLNINNGCQKGHKSVKESKQKKEKTLGDSMKVLNNGNILENGSNKKTRDCSMEDSSSFYSRYDKEVPELRDSIKDYAQYTEYVQEFQEKYDCYVSLSENLEKIKNEFLKTGEELELAKGGSSEEYYKVVRRLREMYDQYGERNNQMKRVFTVLHEELKTLKQRMQDFVDMNSRE